MAKKQKIKQFTKRSLTTFISKLLKRNKNIRLVSYSEYDDDGNLSAARACGCMCKTCTKRLEDNVDKRKRQIGEDGSCQVSYKSAGYKKWSGFNNSCFMDNYDYDRKKAHCRKCRTSYSWECDCGYIEKQENKPIETSVKKTMKYLYEHDEDEGLYPVAIEYGKGYKRSIPLRLKMKK